MWILSPADLLHVLQELDSFLQACCCCSEQQQDYSCYFCLHGLVISAVNVWHCVLQSVHYMSGFIYNGADLQ